MKVDSQYASFCKVAWYFWLTQSAVTHDQFWRAWSVQQDCCLTRYVFATFNSDSDRGSDLKSTECLRRQCWGLFVGAQEIICLWRSVHLTYSVEDSLVALRRHLFVTLCPVDMLHWGLFIMIRRRLHAARYLLSTNKESWPLDLIWTECHRRYTFWAPTKRIETEICHEHKHFHIDECRRGNVVRCTGTLDPTP